MWKLLLRPGRCSPRSVGRNRHRGVEMEYKSCLPWTVPTLNKKLSVPARPRRHFTAQSADARRSSRVGYHISCAPHLDGMGGGVCNVYIAISMCCMRYAVRIHPDGTDTRQSPAHRRRLARSTRAPRGTDTGARAICGPCAGGREGHCAVNSFLSLGLLCFRSLLAVLNNPCQRVPPHPPPTCTSAPGPPARLDEREPQREREMHPHVVHLHLRPRRTALSSLRPLRRHLHHPRRRQQTPPPAATRRPRPRPQICPPRHNSNRHPLPRWIARAPLPRPVLTKRCAYVPLLLPGHG